MKLELFGLFIVGGAAGAFAAFCWPRQTRDALGVLQATGLERSIVNTGLTAVTTNRALARSK